MSRIFSPALHTRWESLRQVPRVRSRRDAEIVTAAQNDVARVRMVVHVVVVPERLDVGADEASP